MSANDPRREYDLWLSEQRGYLVGSVLSLAHFLENGWSLNDSVCDKAVRQAINAAKAIARAEYEENPWRM